ncbi:hypothetical protein [Shinella sp. HZN7]|nr:hypothetical protein [Shinella sp. HZN7]ANH04266.1 hypothetical protein shn_09580 [Shinella sp. HZN7]
MITGEWLRGGPSLTLLLNAALERPAAHIARRNIKSKDQPLLVRHGNGDRGLVEAAGNRGAVSAESVDDDLNMDNPTLEPGPLPTYRFSVIEQASVAAAMPSSDSRLASASGQPSLAVRSYCNQREEEMSNYVDDIERALDRLVEVRRTLIPKLGDDKDAYAELAAIQSSLVHLVKARDQERSIAKGSSVAQSIGVVA